MESQEIKFTNNSNYSELYPYLNVSAPPLEEITTKKDYQPNIFCDLCTEEIKVPSSVIHLDCSHSFHLNCFDIKELIDIKITGFPFRCKFCSKNLKKEPVINTDLLIKKQNQLLQEEIKDDKDESSFIAVSQKKELISELGLNLISKTSMIIDYDWFVQNHVTWDVLAQCEISFQQLFNVCGVTTIDQLKVLEFKKKYFLSHKNLYDIKDLVLHLKCNFSDLNSWFGVSFKDLIVLKISAHTFHRLGLNCTKMVLNHRLTKQSIKTLRFRVDSWVCLLGMDEKFIKTIGIEENEFESYFGFSYKTFISYYQKFMLT
jgi:hypothetical protein